MRCFYHSDQEAVGICKNCHRGICIECFQEVGDGLACKGRCEPQVEKLNTLLKLSSRSHLTVGRTYLQSAPLIGFFGICVLMMGTFMIQRAALFGYGIVGVGAIFILMAVQRYFFGRSYIRMSKGEDSNVSRKEMSNSNDREGFD